MRVFQLSFIKFCRIARETIRFINLNQPDLRRKAIGVKIFPNVAEPVFVINPKTKFFRYPHHPLQSQQLFLLGLEFLRSDDFHIQQLFQLFEFFKGNTGA